MEEDQKVSALVGATCTKDDTGPDLSTARVGMKATIIRPDKTVDTGNRVRYVPEEDCELIRKVVRGYVLDEADPEQAGSVPDMPSKEITDMER